jgi:Putative beta-barrel porin-2, OmpL-like. bbp2
MTSKLFVFALATTFAFAAQAAPRNERFARTPAAAAATTKSTTTTTATTNSVDLPATPVANSSAAGGRHAPLNWDAFIDAQLLVTDKDYALDKGFTVNDAALYLSKDFSRGTAVVDLPFFSSRANGSNGFNFATQKAQAYIHLNYGQVGFRLGQYDSFFGLEANDSVARFFADQGLMKGSGLVPMTHTGAQVVFSADRLTIRGQVANANSASSMQGGTDPELGAQVRFDANNAFGAVGVEYGSYRVPGNPAIQDQQTNLLIELMGGFAMNKFNLGAQADFRKLAGVSGSSNATGADKTGMGIGVLGAYEVSDVLSLGGRIDYLKDTSYLVSPFVATNVLVENAFLISVGPSFKLENDLTLRGDLSVAQAKVQNGSDQTVLGATLSLVARF